MDRAAAGLVVLKSTYLRPRPYALLTQPTVARLLDGTRLTLPIGTITMRGMRLQKRNTSFVRLVVFPRVALVVEFISLATLDVSMHREHVIFTWSYHSWWGNR